jgi:hypothetical protein
MDKSISLKRLLIERNYPFIVYFGIPENHLDLLSFILYTIYMILKCILNFPMWVDLIFSLIFLMISLIFIKYNKNDKYKWSINHAKSFSIFFFAWFLLQFFI